MERYIIKRTDGLRIKYSAGKLKDLQEFTTTTSTLSLLKEGRIVYLRSTDPEALEDLRKHLDDLLPYARKVAWTYPELEEPSKSVEPPVMPSIDEIRERTSTLIEQVSKELKETKVYMEFTYLIHSSTIRGDSREISYSFGGWNMLMILFHVRGSEILEHIFYRPGRDLTDDLIDLKEFSAVTDLFKFESLEEFPSRSLPIVLAPSISFIIPYAVSQALSGDNYLKGLSPIKLGEDLKANLTLIDRVDDPLSFRPLDDEGVLTENKYLIKDGVVSDLLSTLDTSYRLKAEMNLEIKPGNAFIGTTGAMPSYSCLRLELPERRFDDLGEHIRVYSAVGLGQSNLLAGDVRFTATLAGLYRGDKLIARLKPFTIYFNIYETTKSMAGVGDRKLYGRIGSFSEVPWVLLENFQIGK